MKPQLTNPSICEKRHYLSWFLQSYYGLLLFSHALTKRFCRQVRLETQRLRANLDIRAGLAALMSSAKCSERRYAAIICVGVLAPSSLLFYKVFDESVRDNSWYYLNNYYLFYTLGNHSFQFFFYAVAIFLIAPRNSYSEYWAAPFIGYPIVKALMLIPVTSNEEFHASFDTGMWAAVILTGLCFTLGVNFFAFLFNHRERAYECRVDGILNHPYLDDATKVQSMIITRNEYKSFKKAY